MATVVAVDDSPTAIALLESILHHMGHKPVTTTDSRKALDLVKAERPQLVITDIFMPVVDGYELVEKIRADETIAATPVILWTASYVASTVRPIARALGVTHVLTKPTEPDRLMAEITAALGEKVLAPQLTSIPEPVRVEHLESVAATLSEVVVTEGVQIEDLKHQLDTAQAHNQLLFDNHPMPMLIFDVAGREVLEVNEAALWRYGYSRDEFLALKVDQLLPPEALQSRPDDDAVKQGPFAHKTRDGIVFEAETNTYDLIYAGRPARFVTVNDVTERLKLERLLHQSQRLESLGQLAGGVAHDFNNLLAVILNFNQFVFQRVVEASKEPAGERWEPVLKDINRIERAAQNAASLTRQLLTFARKDTAHPQATDINGVVAETEQLLRRTLGEHIEFIVSAEKAVWPVLIDPGQLGQVVTNLAVNARDAMPDGGTLKVETENVHVDDSYAAGRPGLVPGRYVQMRITDTGTGMSAEALQHAFEPFFTTKAVGHGTGLGLSTVHGIVTGAGGHVAIYSEPDVGTRITVLLPATDASHAASETPELPAVMGSGTVLVVEDESELREVVQRILTNRGYEVILAANGPEAIARAGLYPGHIDLLLTDVVMPQMQGTELAGRLEATRPGIRVLYMSGYAEPLLKPPRSPSLGVLEKPFTEPTLLAKVNGALHPRRGKATRSNG